MRFIDKTYTATYEVKQSKFIAFLVLYRDFQSTLSMLKEQHPKARHFVTAYRYLNEFNQIVEGFSDDGEPKGTSGKPSLMVLQGADMIECAVITVRYFGGTKLGTGGLVRAYSEAVNMVLQDAVLLEYKQQFKKQILVAYEHDRMIEYECEKFDIEILKKEFSEAVIYTLSASKENMQKFLSKVERLVSIYP